MEKKSKVAISRKWHNPQISIIVTDEQLSFCITLDDFREALRIELQLNDKDKERFDEGFRRAIDRVTRWSTRSVK